MPTHCPESTLSRRFLICAAPAALLVACAAPPPPEPEQHINNIPVSQIVPGYGVLPDGQYTLPPIPPEYLRGVNRRRTGHYNFSAASRSIIIDPHAKYLYWIEDALTAVRYPIAVGREGRGMGGTTVIRRKAEWPGWTPTANMLRREPQVYGPYAGGIPGGLASPLGARALYLYRGGRDTYYRIHGTNDLGSIGNSGSAGCIRLFNHDIIDLFGRVPLETSVTIRTYADSVRIEGEAIANRGIELPPFALTEEELYDEIETQRPPVPQAMISEDGTYAPDILAQMAAPPATNPLAASSALPFAAGG